MRETKMAKVTKINSIAKPFRKWIRLINK